MLKLEVALSNGNVYNINESTNITYIVGAKTQIDQTEELVAKNILYYKRAIGLKRIAIKAIKIKKQCIHQEFKNSAKLV